MIRAYRIFNALSLDVAVGASISATFVASWLGVSLAWTTVITLGICVWIIYTLDHLIDAKNIPHSPHTFRHWFHQQYFNRISVALGIAALTEIVLLQYLPFSTLIGGIALSIVVMLYFSILWWLRLNKVYHKEILIAFVYTSGVFLPSVSICGSPLDRSLILLFFQLFLIALSNLLIFSVLETNSDMMDGQKSLATILGEVQSKQIIWLLIILGMCIALVGRLVADKNALAQGVLLFINIILGLIMLLPSWRKGDRYRFIGDGVFYIFLIFILLA